MTAPVWDSAPVWLALPIGIAFGAILERAGLGSARTIAAQLSFNDWTVVKVMFTAIVTAMLGVFWTQQLGWLDLSRVAIPTTDVGPQLLGAVIFGVGFALAALCPGTACVSAATGRVDGVAAVGGIFAGSLLTAELWPQLGTLAERAPRDGARLSDDLAVPAGLIVLAIVLMAVVACAIAGAVERARRGETAWPAGARTPSRPAVAALALGALGAMARPTDAVNEPSSMLNGQNSATAGTRLSGASVRVSTLQELAREISREADHVDPLDLATWIRDRHATLRVYEVRESLTPDSATDRYIIPGALSVALPDVPSLTIASGDTVVLYSEGGTHAAQAWVLLRARGVRNVFVLRDGLAAWEDEVLTPTAPTDTSTAARERYARARALRSWFGGSSFTPALPAPATGVPKRVVRRRNTC